MVFLTSLDILDTGFLTVTTRQSQLDSGDRVNSGSVLRLKSVDINIQSTSNLDAGVSPGYSASDIKNHEKRALVSINPIPVTIKLLINSRETDTSGYYGINDMSLLPYLLKLPQTKGWKAIYYPVDNTANDTGSNTTNQRNQQIVYQLGATDTTEDQGDIDITIWTNTTSASSKDLTDVNYIPIRFKSCKINQITTNKILVTLQGVVTG